MRLPKCINCNHKLSWSQIFKRMMIAGNNVECSHCHHKLFFAPESKKKIYFLVALIPILFIFLIALHISMIIVVSVLIIYHFSQEDPSSRNAK